MTRTTGIFQRFGIGVLILLAASGMVAPQEAHAQNSPSKEYQVKAAFLLNFLQFIEWPAAAFGNAETPITIGVLGDDPFGAILEKTFQDEIVQGRKLMVKRSKQVEDMKACHVVFVCKSESDHVADILTSLNDTNIVTIGEIDGFAGRGGIINFYFDDKKLRFEINPTAAQRKGLKISSQLLKRAKIVASDQGKR